MSEYTSFNEELARLKKGVRVAWLINFSILYFTVLAGLVFAFMGTTGANEQVLSTLTFLAVISGVLSLIIMVLVTNFASQAVMGGVPGNHFKVEEGLLYNIVEEMAIASGSKMPEVYVLQGSGVLNAYAVSNGTDSRVVVTDELLQNLTREEVQGVIAHEIGHIHAGDSEAMTKIIALTSVVSIVAGAGMRMMGSGNSRGGKPNPLALVLIVLSLVFLLVAPLLSKVANAYMSRTRESQADALAVRFTRNPKSLHDALLKISNTPVNAKENDEVLNKVGQVAFFSSSSWQSKLSTHPPIQERLEALRKMGA